MLRFLQGLHRRIYHRIVQRRLFQRCIWHKRYRIGQGRAYYRSNGSRRLQRFNPYPPSRRSATAAGFVLPTATLLLLIVSLSIGAITLRAYDQTTWTSRDRQRGVVVNAASPALDRAKAKLDFLLDRRSDPRLPAGVPHQDRLEQMLLNRTPPILPVPGEPDTDPYTLPGETRLDLDGDGTTDNAWRYRTRLGDDSADAPPNATVVYGIWLRQPATDADLSAGDRARLGLVRHTPLGNAYEANPLCQSRYGSELATAYADAGWTADPAHPSRHHKNVQVDVLVLPDDPGSAIATLELQQDRQFHQGLPWGAWFEHDLEIASDEPFQWNGAIHAEGSVVVDSDGTVALFPVSAATSCLADAAASRITTGRVEARTPAFEGYGIAGSLEDDRLGGRADLYDGAGDTVTLSSATDTLPAGLDHPAELLQDPLIQLTEGRQVHRNPDAISRDSALGEASVAAQRIRQRLYPKREDLPYARDRFRADDRYGPEPRIGGRLIPGAIGEPIVGDRLAEGLLPLSDARLTRNRPPEDTSPLDDTERVGLDGYWERRARLEGLRLIVGQRLRLGGVPLPWSGCPDTARDRCHEARQRQSLRDVLAAVQSTLIYPAHASEPDRPSACLLSAVHPGTAGTLTASSRFIDRSAALQDFLPEGFYTGKPIVSDLFNGQGTNGWEYEPLPAAVRTEADFEAAIAPNRPLGRALRNLAHFAGDPLGGSPSFTPPDTVGAAHVYPYSLLAAWGDFSLLRRILTALDRPGAASYRLLSPADKTTLHSAACSLGMLAYNLGYLVQITYPVEVAGDLPEPLQQLIQALYAIDATALGTPAAVVAALNRHRAEVNLAPSLITLARTIALKEQVRRDRRWGFVSGSVESPLGEVDPVLQSLIPTQPAFPALRYLVPPPEAVAGGLEDSPIAPWRDDYIAELNRDWRYRSIDLADDAVLSTLAVAPRPLADWWLPQRPASAGSVLSDRALYLDCDGAACSGGPGRVQIAIKEAALFDGREMLLARVLDLDIDQLRRGVVLGDSWLPETGIVYAFREDAVREDSINRPAQDAGAACSEYAVLVSVAGGCRLDASPAADDSRDPPLSDRAISPKPVDGLPDPDRRPYGFRLRNGARLSRSTHAHGLSFITDNPVYILGDFNLHQRSGCRGDCPLGEFRELLPTDRTYRPREFYRRRTLDPRFAHPQQDDWRASEIIADSITVLSKQFCDGSIEDTWMTAGVAQPRLPRETMAAYGCRNRDRRSSFLNQNRPSSQPAAPDRDSSGPWQRTLPSDPSSPVVVSSRGSPVLSSGEDYGGDYFAFADPKPLVRARPQRVNAILISGGVPPRVHQSSGGLPGQLRLLENWETLAFSGAWIQLGVSRYGTAPTDQDAWEAAARPRRDRYDHYSRSERLPWRYDTALDYGVAPPVARQLVTLAANPHSEFYSTPAATDAYLALLCRAAAPERCP